MMNADFLITFDRGHARVYRKRSDPATRKSGLTLVESIDLPEGKHSYTEHASDQAGRFPRSRGLEGGMGIDERLPMERERDKRVSALIVEIIERVLEKEPETTWVCAAGPDMLKPVVETLDASIKARLKATMQKNLTNAPLEEVLEHFAEITL